MLGVIIGIVSVVMVVGIGEGVKREIAGQINQFGSDLITIRPGNLHQNNGKLVTNTDLLFGLNTLSGLNTNDLQTVQSSAHVKLAAPLGVVPGTVQVDGHNFQNTMVLATNASLSQALNHGVQYGDFFDAQDPGAKGAVIGAHVVSALFGDPVPLGRTFTFRGQQFIVRGIFSEFQSTPLSPASNFNSTIFIPATVAETLTGNTTQMYSILAKPDSASDTETAIANINKDLRNAHGGEQDFTVLNQQQNLDASSNVLGLLTTMIIAVAGVSLLVGGVGIMNIMLASVTERMHEIGVRKAIGATNRQILNQFVLEAAVLSVFGGLVGVLLSIGAIFALRAYTTLQPVVSWQAISVATLTSLAIGIVFGTVPAVKAARKDPIEALRHE